MTTRTWNGTNGNFGDAGSWSPTGVPQPGDTAVINSGTVLASGLTLSTLTLDLTQTGTAASTTLSLANTTLAADTTLNVNNPNLFNSTAPTISFAGTVANNGTANFAGNSTGSQVLLPIAAGSLLVNRGAMNFIQTSPQVSGGGTLENDGTIALVNPAAVAQIPVFSDAVTGTGTIALGEHARIALNSVGSGQTVLLNDGANGNETLELDTVGAFAGAINGFSSSDLISVPNTPFTNATYTSTGANSGTLNLFNGGTLEGSLRLLGQYSLSNLGFSFNNFGGGLSNLQISTTAVNAQSGGLPPGYQNGGSGSGGSVGVAPVYRFFDKNFGTHFFTADAGEKATVLATRPDLVEETNDFGDVSSADPNAEPVFRFFDSVHGTHFFTASTSERDTLIGTRSDLVYEPNSTFYEHPTQQSGDIPVYRFFDTQYGTHFYTGDAGEAASTAALLVAGTSQHQYTAEGVGFYAPAGTFA